MMKFTPQHSLYLAFLLSIALINTVGCGNGNARLSGEVTLDGELVLASEDIRGTISFEPRRGAAAAPAVAKIGPDGRYSAVTGAGGGLAPGEYSVTVNVLKVIPPKEEGGMPWPERISPRRYTSAKTSGLSVVVEPGSNKFDIELETSGERNG